MPLCTISSSLRCSGMKLLHFESCVGCVGLRATAGTGGGGNDGRPRIGGVLSQDESTGERQGPGILLNDIDVMKGSGSGGGGGGGAKHGGGGGGGGGETGVECTRGDGVGEALTTGDGAKFGVTAIAAGGGGAESTSIGTLSPPLYCSYNSGPCSRALLVPFAFSSDGLSSRTNATMMFMHRVFVRMSCSFPRMWVRIFSIASESCGIVSLRLC